MNRRGQLASVPEVGTSTSLNFFADGSEDQWGNVCRWASAIYFDEDSQSLSTDVFFERQP